MLGPLRRRLRYLLNRDERARLLREEMEFHVDMRTEELMADGLAESEARGLARRQFGNLTQQQEAARATWVTRWLSDLAQDLVYAGRTFRNQPGFAAVAALSAALGIGACSMIFGVANHALFHRLPVHEPSQLVSISSKSLARGKVGMSLPYPDYEDMRGAQSFQGMTAFFSFLPVIISSNGLTQRYWGSLVTSNYFDVVRPVLALGRGFASASEKG
ncbi:MAG TPA: permease prefix domain 1-containing protein, partial [Bryobacteraceae bacterium]|nr:permease prefix domain 1-containing protein [Bryobacteraceae bacterium]